MMTKQCFGPFGSKAHSNQVYFNKTKCKTPSLRTVDTGYTHRNGNRFLKSTDPEKDLGLQYKVTV